MRGMLPPCLRRPSACFSFSFSLRYAKIAPARVSRVEVASREDVLSGKTFGDAGPYERIAGTIYFSLPVDNVHNTAIVDLKNAVNLRNGEVEFSADFIAIRPKDPKRANGSLLLEVPNRGRSRIVAWSTAATGMSRMMPAMHGC